MTTLYLIRHGEVDNPLNLTYGRVRDIDLTPRGKLQIHSLAELIRERGEIPDVIFSSPLKRTVQSTEEILGVFPNIPVEYRDDLMETESTNYVGRPLDWARGLGNPYNKEFMETYQYHVESEQHQVDRMMRVVNEALSGYKDGIICMVSHGDPLAFLVDAFHHSGKQSSTIEELKKDIYLLRGEAWRIVLDEEDTLVSTERISPTVPDHSQTER